MVVKLTYVTFHSLRFYIIINMNLTHFTQEHDFTSKESLRRYFSCVTMTTTGFGLIKPQHWATHIAVLIQMLISTLYHIVIFGLGLCYLFGVWAGV